MTGTKFNFHFFICNKRLNQDILGVQRKMAEGDSKPELIKGFVNKRPGKHCTLLLTTGDGDQVGYVILTVWNSCELFADRYKQLLFLVMESN